jgi:hypothetical protein
MGNYVDVSSNEVNDHVRDNPLNETLLATKNESGELESFVADGQVTKHPFLVSGTDQPWTDLRISASSTQVNGSNPPTDALFKNDGLEVPDVDFALSFISIVLGTAVIPDDIVFDTAADFTFEFWIRPTVATLNNVEFLRKRDVFELDFRGLDQINLDVKGGGGNADSSIAYNRGSWNFIVVQHDLALAETYLYINNMLAVTIGASTNDSTRDIEINRNTNVFDIDYIAYWDAKLTPAELTDRYASGNGSQLVGNEVGLKGLWELNDGAGTTLLEKTGITSDGSITSGAIGVDFAWIGGHVGNISFGSRGVLLKYFSPTNPNELYFSAQLPHEWLEGSNLEPHVHWVPNANGAAGERVRWGFEYTWTAPFSSFENTTLMYATTNAQDIDLVKDDHLISRFGTLDATGKTLSSMLICRVFRDAEDVGDTFTDFAGFLEFDFHYQKNTLGSRQEFVK